MRPADAAPEEAPPRLQRASGRVEIAVRHAGGRTRLARLHQEGSGKARFPKVPVGASLRVILLNMAGGLTDGDRLAIEVAAGQETRVALGTAAAEKIWRARSAPARVTVRLAAEAGALVAWLPEETILCDGARLDRRLTIDLDQGANFLAVDMLVVGRAAMGETVRTGSLLDRYELRRGGRLVRVDALALDGDIAARLDRTAQGRGARAILTGIRAGPGADEALDPLRAEIEACCLDGGATCRDGVLTLRVLSPRAETLRAALPGLRQALATAIEAPLAAS